MSIGIEKRRMYRPEDQLISVRAEGCRESIEKQAQNIAGRRTR